MKFPHTTAAFILPQDIGGLRHVVLTRPKARPSMQFLPVGSYVCAQTSSGQHLARCPCRRLVVPIVSIDNAVFPTGDLPPSSHAHAERPQSAPSGVMALFSEASSRVAHGKRYVFVVTSRSFRCSTNGKKSRPANRSSSWLSMQNAAICRVIAMTWGLPL
jgi:hypothetical protein